MAWEMPNHRGPNSRWSEPQDADRLAALHAASWRYAYAGVIPEPGLSRMISRRGPSWWRKMHESGARALVATLGDDVVGYALAGRCRAGPGGEVQEIYVRPDCQGAGFGARLFEASRRELKLRGMTAITVWCLAENTIGLGFYRALGGRESGRSIQNVAGARLQKVRFIWP